MPRNLSINLVKIEISVTKIFFDSAPFIYLIENHPEYGEVVADYIETQSIEASEFVTSVISLAEFSVFPERNNRPDLIADFDKLVRRASFDLLIIDRQIAEQAAKLRATYRWLKSLDALQIAAATASGCSHFFTNDKDLKRIPTINVLLVSDL